MRELLGRKRKRSRHKGTLTAHDCNIFSVLFYCLKQLFAIDNYWIMYHTGCCIMNDNHWINLNVTHL